MPSAAENRRVGTHPAPRQAVPRGLSDEPRPAETARDFEGVSDYLSWDHARLKGLLEAVIDDVAAGRFAAALDRYTSYHEGLRRHIRIEEELVFPLFEARTGINSGPTEVMRSEHREIERGAAIMAEALEAADPDRFEEGQRFLDATLPQHNAKEQHILYPTTDRLLTDSERRSLTERLQRE